MRVTALRNFTAPCFLPLPIRNGGVEYLSGEPAAGTQNRSLRNSAFWPLVTMEVVGRWHLRIPYCLISYMAENLFGLRFASVFWSNSTAILQDTFTVLPAIARDAIAWHSSTRALFTPPPSGGHMSCLFPSRWFRAFHFFHSPARVMLFGRPGPDRYSFYSRGVFPHSDPSHLLIRFYFFVTESNWTGQASGPDLTSSRSASTCPLGEGACESTSARSKGLGQSLLPTAVRACRDQGFST